MLRESWIVFPAEVQRLSESDLDPAWSEEVLTPVEDFLDSAQPDRYDWHPQPGRDEADAGLKRVDLARFGAFAFREEENRPSAADQVAKIPQRSARSGFCLRQGKRVEKQRQKPVQKAVPEPLELGMPLRMKMGIEEFFPHRDRRAIPVSRGESRQDARRVHVALMIRGEDDGPAQSRQVFPASPLSPSEQTSQGQPQGE